MTTKRPSLVVLPHTATCLLLIGLLVGSGRICSAEPASGQTTISLQLGSTGLVSVQLDLSSHPDEAHGCVLSDGPDPTYLLAFGKTPLEPQLPIDRPGLFLTVPRPDQVAWRSTLAGGTIQVVVDGRRFIGLGKPDPDYLLQVTLDADGRHGSLSAQHLVDEAGGGTIDLQGSWSCNPATTPTQVDASATDARSGSGIQSLSKEATAESPHVGPAAKGTAVTISTNSHPAETMAKTPAPAMPGSVIKLDATAPPQGPAEPDRTREAALPIEPTPSNNQTGSVLAAGQIVARADGAHERRDAMTSLPRCTSPSAFANVVMALAQQGTSGLANRPIIQFRAVRADARRADHVGCSAMVLLADGTLHPLAYAFDRDGQHVTVSARIAAVTAASGLSPFQKTRHPAQGQPGETTLPAKPDLPFRQGEPSRAADVGRDEAPSAITTIRPVPPDVTPRS